MGGLMSTQAIMDLAARVAPIVRPYGQQHGQLTPEAIRQALKQIGSGACSDRTVLMIDNFICDMFV